MAKTKQDEIPDAIKKAIVKVTNKRPKTVIDHIVEHGFITTEELKDRYGYNHPPRAARDVREAGIPLETFKVKGTDGRAIGAYRFADPSEIEHHKLAGRKVFSKPFRKFLYERCQGNCEICSTQYEERYLTVDHCVPYEVAGEQVASEDTPEAFLFICATCQRQKSWSCENCDNFTAANKKQEICESCYWGQPDGHTHVALRQVRRLDVVWSDSDIDVYERLAEKAKAKSVNVSDLVREYVANQLSEET